MPNATSTSTTATELAEGFFHEIRKHERGPRGRHIVKFKENAPKVACSTGLLIESAKITITHEWDIVNAIAGKNACCLSCSDSITELLIVGNFDDEAINSSRKNPDVEYIEEDAIVHISQDA